MKTFKPKNDIIRIAIWSTYDKEWHYAVQTSSGAEFNNYTTPMDFSYVPSAVEWFNKNRDKLRANASIPYNDYDWSSLRLVKIGHIVEFPLY